MELINKNSKKVREHIKYVRFSPFVSIGRGKKYIHFPLSTIELVQMRNGQYVHFVDAGKTTLFLVNEDSAGYKLYPNSSKDASLRCCSAAVVDWFCDKYHLKKDKPFSFYVCAVNTEYQGQKLFEILTDTPRIDKKHKVVKK